MGSPVHYSGSSVSTEETKKKVDAYMEASKFKPKNKEEKLSEEIKMSEIFRLFAKLDECKEYQRVAFKEYNHANKEVERAKADLFAAIDKLDKNTKDTLKNLLDGASRDSLDELDESR